MRALAINLRARGYDVYAAATRPRRWLAAAHLPDVVILDLGLPDIDGVDVIHGLRGWTTVPIIVLSGRTDSADKVDALDAGADDYLTKPFGIDELLARLRAVSAAHPGEATPVVDFGDVTVDLAATPGHASTGRPARSGSPRPSGTCWRCCSGTRASC